MINYKTIQPPQILSIDSEILDDSVFTSAGGIQIFRKGLWLFTYMQIISYQPLNFLFPNNPDFYFEIGSSTGAIMTLPFFGSNNPDPVFIIYPNDQISNGLDMASSGILNFSWNGNAGYTPIGTTMKLRSYYLEQPIL
jgi:hypothetical protein